MPPFARVPSKILPPATAQVVIKSGRLLHSTTCVTDPLMKECNAFTLKHHVPAFTTASAKPWMNLTGCKLAFSGSVRVCLSVPVGIPVGKKEENEYAGGHTHQYIKGEQQRNPLTFACLSFQHSI